jgi:hypothetical protein
MTTTNKTGSPADSLGERFVELRHDVANNVGKRVDSLGALIKGHPLAALGIGLGLGYLIARLIHR